MSAQSSVRCKIAGTGEYCAVQCPQQRKRTPFRRPLSYHTSKTVSRVLFLTAIYLDTLLPMCSSRLLRTAGPAICPRHGVAPDRVYSGALFPGTG